MRYLSPLRYPGGKGRLAGYIGKMLDAQSVRPKEYAEPFAGGAGAALRVLVEEQVRTIHINDLSPGISAFWRSVFFNTDEFLERVRTCPIDLDSWAQARAVYDNPESQDDIELGFATFFLNRCNRSGILTAGPIGGYEQRGAWKIDARFNRESLSERISFISQYRKRVRVTQLDAREFLDSLESKKDRVLVYVDPPYLVQGESLYLDSLSYTDHSELAQKLKTSEYRWFLTYDADERITEDLYEGLRCMEFDIAHTAQHQHVGSEYAVFSDYLDIPDGELLRNDAVRWVAW